MSFVMNSKISFCKETKTWTVQGEKDDIFPDTESFGYTILNSLSKFPQNKILEHHFESNVDLSVEQISLKSKNCAENLLKSGIQKGDIVVIFSQVNEDVTPLIIGCLVIGAVFNAFETNFNDEETAFALNLLQPKAIFYNETFQSKIQYLFCTSNLKLFLPFGKGNSSVSSTLFKPLEREFTSKDFIDDASQIPACIIFTSGSTGRPKGVLLSHSILRHEVFNWMSISSQDTLFVASPLRWVSHMSLLFQPFFTGCLRIVSNSPANPELFCKIIEYHKVSHFFGVVGLLAQMLQISENKIPGCLRSLKSVASGGEVVAMKVRRDLVRLLPDCKVISVYGMSEVGGLAAHNEFLEDKRINGGNLVPGFQYKVIDSNSNSLNPGEPGTILIKYKRGFLKYINNDRANEESFTGDEWYNTGDFGRIYKQGILEIFGRCKDNIICNCHLVRIFKIFTFCFVNKTYFYFR